MIDAGSRFWQISPNLTVIVVLTIKRQRSKKDHKRTTTNRIGMNRRSTLIYFHEHLPHDTVPNSKREPSKPSCHSRGHGHVEVPFLNLSSRKLTEMTRDVPTPRRLGSARLGSGAASRERAWPWILGGFFVRSGRAWALKWCSARRLDRRPAADCIHDRLELKQLGSPQG